MQAMCDVFILHDEYEQEISGTIAPGAWTITPQRSHTRTFSDLADNIQPLDFLFLPSLLGNPVCNRNDNAHGEQGNILVSNLSKEDSCAQL